METYYDLKMFDAKGREFKLRLHRNDVKKIIKKTYGKESHTGGAESKVWFVMWNGHKFAVKYLRSSAERKAEQLRAAERAFDRLTIPGVKYVPFVIVRESHGRDYNNWLIQCHIRGRRGSNTSNKLRDQWSSIDGTLYDHYDLCDCHHGNVVRKNRMWYLIDW